MSFMSDALVGMVCSPRRPAKRRDFSRAISSNSRCFSVSLSDTGIGMASVASITLDAILAKKEWKCNSELQPIEYKLIRHHTDIQTQCRMGCIRLWVVKILLNTCWKLGQWCKSESSSAAQEYVHIANLRGADNAYQSESGSNGLVYK